MANPNLLGTAVSIELKTKRGKVEDDYTIDSNTTVSSQTIINLSGNQSAKIVSLYFCNESTSTAYTVSIGVGSYSAIVSHLFKDVSVAAGATWIAINADAPIYLDSTADQFKIVGSAGAENYVDYILSYELIDTQ